MAKEQKEQVINLDSLEAASMARAQQLALELYNLNTRKKAIKDELQQIAVSQQMLSQVNPGKPSGDNGQQKQDQKAH